MRITWRGLELPTRIVRDVQVSNERYSKFTVEPFERGFGTTIGNSLRRILLSSLEGYSVEWIKIAGADHEFTQLKGVVEDVTDLVLNIKQIVVRMQDDMPRTMKLSVNKAGKVTAGMIQTDSAIEIVNKDLVLATLTEDVKFEIEMGVGIGRGYSSAAERIAQKDRFDQEAGLIEIDAIYSPVLRVRYKTEDTRVGQRTNYDKLILEIWTNGTILPQMAMVEASKILRKYINPFVQYCEVEEETVENETSVVEAIAAAADDTQIAAMLAMPIEQLNLTVRSSNCLEANSIQTVGQLVAIDEAELMKFRSFGKTSLREVRQKLSDLGLSLGMNAPC